MKKITSILTVLTVAMTMVFTSMTGVFADAPQLEKMKYKGSGKVEVEFEENVIYSGLSVSVKDTDGNSYSTKIIEKDDDELEFKIKDYKKGKTYNITVNGVKAEGTEGFGSVSGKVKIPAETSTISKDKAISIAKTHAKSKWNAKRFRDVDVERDTYKGSSVWEVEFDARSGGSEYEYDYNIRRSDGKILKVKRELD